MLSEIKELNNALKYLVGLAEDKATEWANSEDPDTRMDAARALVAIDVVQEYQSRITLTGDKDGYQ